MQAPKSQQSLSRRAFLAAAAATPALALPRPAGVLVDTHIHLFAADQKRFPFHPSGTYQPPAADLEDYKKFAALARIDHVIIVHPEPYQDDHRYLEHCFENEPSEGYFKGTCLFDPIAPETPARMAELAKQWPGRIVAARYHAMNRPGEKPLEGGPIKNRDLADPRVREFWRAAGENGIAVQMHFLPHHAPKIRILARAFPEVNVILDHLARAGQGSEQDYGEVLRLGSLPNVYMKFSGVRYSSKEDFPYRDAMDTVRRAFDAFTPDRMIWGGLGHTLPEFENAVSLFELMFRFASPGDRAKIRGETATKLFGFRG